MGKRLGKSQYFLFPYLSMGSFSHDARLGGDGKDDEL